MQSAVTPFLMFEGQAEEAMNLYVRTIPDSEILNVQRYGPDGPGPEGSVMLASISLRGQPVLLSDSYVSHDFTFTPSISLFVACQSEEELAELSTGPRRGRQIPDAARQLRLQPPLRMGRGPLRRVLAVESALGDVERIAMALPEGHPVILPPLPPIRFDTSKKIQDRPPSPRRSSPLASRSRSHRTMKIFLCSKLGAEVRHTRHQ